MNFFKNYFYNEEDKRYLNIALPAAMEGIFMILLVSADLIMVGTLGSSAVAAVSIFAQLRMALLCATRSLAATVTLLTARKAGAGDTGGIAALLRQSFFLGSVFMGLVHFLFFLYTEEILIIMGATPDYLEQAKTYAFLANISVYISALSTFLQAIQLGFGETGAIMKTNIAGNIVNVICNYFLIFGVGPIPPLGVMGAALGTIIGTLVTLLLTIYLMQKEHYFHWGSFLPNKAFYNETSGVFASVFTEQGAERIGMVAFARMATSLGTVPFAVHSICMNVSDLYFCFAQGFGKASMVLSGQCYGAKDANSWKHYTRAGIKWSFLFSTLAFLVIAIFRKQIFGLYSSDAEALALSSLVMLIVAVVNYPVAQALVAAGILRGAGMTKAVAICYFISVTVLRPLNTAIFIYYFHWGLIGAWLALLIDQVLRATLSSYLLRKVQI